MPEYTLLFSRKQALTLALAGTLLLPGCSLPLALATGAGAAVGVAAAQEGGIKGTASDLKIKAKISDNLFKYDLETFSKLNLTVEQGRVLVTGVVQDPEDRVEAIRRIWQVEGVNQVINEIRIAEGEGLPGYVRDKWITTRLRTVLTFDKHVQSVNYSIDTVQGTVYLMGVAQNQAELNHVIEVARTVPNVRQVISYVKMAGPDGQAERQSKAAPAPQTEDQSTDSAEIIRWETP